MQKVTILKGVPASGKSTWAKEEVRMNPNTINRVNKDDLRAMINNSIWSKENENYIIQLRNNIIKDSLLNGKSIIIDDTNLHSKHENQIRQITLNCVDILKQNILFEVKWFHIDKKEAIERDKNRTKKVGEKVINEMFEQYEKIKDKSDKIEILYPSFTQIVYNPSIPDCVIVDIDGTIAERGDRSPFDWKKVGEDKPKRKIIKLVRLLSQDFHIIFLSGRDGVCYKETKEWLDRWSGVENYELFMRTPNDNRKDSIMKKELFMNHVYNRYNVYMVIDDRDQVVSMWRNELGFTCLQVDYGNF